MEEKINVQFTAACPLVTKERFYAAVTRSGMKIQSALAEALEMWADVREGKAALRRKAAPKEAA